MFARVNELPVLPSDSIIVNAGIYFCQIPDSYNHVGMSTMNVPVYALTAGPGGSYDSQYSTSGNWIKTRTWNTQPYYREVVQDYAKIRGVMAGLGLAGMTKVGAKLFGGPIIGGVLAVIGALEWVSAQYDNAQLQLLMEIDAAGTGMVTWDLSIDGPTGSSGYNYWDSSKSSVDYGTYPYIKTSTY